MNKKEFIDLMATVNEGMKKKEAEAALNAVLGTIENALENGEEEISFSGYMTIKVKDVAEVTRPNPQNREEMITTPAHKTVKIKVGSKLKSLV